MLKYLKKIRHYGPGHNIDASRDRIWLTSEVPSVQILNHRFKSSWILHLNRWFNILTCNLVLKFNKFSPRGPELGTFKWWLSGLRLDPLFFLISRLNYACSPLIINLQINYPIGIKDILFLSFQLRTRTQKYHKLCEKKLGTAAFAVKLRLSS